MSWLPASPPNSCTRISLPGALAATHPVQRQYCTTTPTPALLLDPLLQDRAGCDTAAFAPPKAPKARAGRKRKVPAQPAPAREARNPKQMRKEACEKAEATRGARERRELAQQRMAQRKKEFRQLVGTPTARNRRPRAQAMNTTELKAMKDRQTASLAMDADGRHIYQDADGKLDMTAFYRDRAAQTAYNASPDGGLTFPFRKWDGHKQRMVGDTAAYWRYNHQRRKEAFAAFADASVWSTAQATRMGGPIIGR